MLFERLGFWSDNWKDSVSIVLPTNGPINDIKNVTTPDTLTLWYHQIE